MATPEEKIAEDQESSPVDEGGQLTSAPMAPEPVNEIEELEPQQTIQEKIASMQIEINEISRNGDVAQSIAELQSEVAKLKEEIKGKDKRNDREVIRDDVGCCVISGTQIVTCVLDILRAFGVLH